MPDSDCPKQSAERGTSWCPRPRLTAPYLLLHIGSQVSSASVDGRYVATEIGARLMADLHALMGLPPLGHCFAMPAWQRSQNMRPCDHVSTRAASISNGPLCEQRLLTVPGGFLTPTYVHVGLLLEVIIGCGNEVDCAAQNDPMHPNMIFDPASLLPLIEQEGGALDRQRLGGWDLPDLRDLRIVA